MAFTYEQFLRLALPAAGDTNWDAEVNANFEYLSQVVSPTSVYHVSPGFTTANLGNASASDRRHFPTIQDAVTAVEALSPTYTSKHTVKVWPGVYNENVVVTMPMTIAAAITTMPCWGFGGGTSVEINGTTTTQEACVKITPTDSVWVTVNLIGLYFENAYNQAATTIDKGLAVQLDAPTTYGTYGNRVNLVNCTVRGQTWGASNDWRSVIDLDGWFECVLQNTWVKGIDYAGGSYDGGCRSIIRGLGPGVASTLESEIRLIGGALNNIYKGTEAATCITHTNVANVYRYDNDLSLSAPNASSAAHMVTGIPYDDQVGGSGYNPEHKNTVDKWPIRL